MLKTFSSVRNTLRTYGIQAVFLSLFAVLTPCQIHAATFNCTVVKVSDGDTIKCRTADNGVHKIRLINIDAPEKSQQYGRDSTRHLAKMIFSRNVLIKYNSRDRYGRILGDIYYKGASINKEMVRSGNAWAFREYLNDNEYLTLEKQARKERLGLWAYPHPEYPKDYRKRQKQSDVKHNKHNKHHKHNRNHYKPHYR